MVGHLAVADSLMGVYMLIIASADVYYRDIYAYYAEEWQTSAVCKFAGFLSVLSSEGSVFFMTAISVDRFIGVVYPFSKVKLRPKSTHITAGLIWFLAFIISLLPLLIRGYFNDNFYSRSSVCLALPLTTERPSGWEYSTTIFLGVNMTAFIVMLACYGVMYMAVKSSAERAGRRDVNRAQEVELALRMAFLVFSDMFCWMPIVIMGILATTRVVEIPPISYAWIAVFVLPLNSSLNPYLYTILTREMSKKKKSQSSKETLSSHLNKAYQLDDGAGLQYLGGNYFVQ
ncbi:G-protein coupled receptor GRL101-like [Amphiura filiformis]|uniref:G-protein coupled receptor GRL101-like n=1 Tax=Amphiura filiformis TaxID=82378 RepID=UPI003B20D127